MIWVVWPQSVKTTCHWCLDHTIRAKKVSTHRPIGLTVDSDGVVNVVLKAMYTDDDGSPKSMRGCLLYFGILQP